MGAMERRIQILETKVHELEILCRNFQDIISNLQKEREPHNLKYVYQPDKYTHQVHIQGSSGPHGMGIDGRNNEGYNSKNYETPILGFEDASYEHSDYKVDSGEVQIFSTGHVGEVGEYRMGHGHEAGSSYGNSLPLIDLNIPSSSSSGYTLPRSNLLSSNFHLTVGGGITPSNSFRTSTSSSSMLMMRKKEKPRPRKEKPAKTYSCQLCDKVYSSSSSRKIHMQVRHEKTRNKYTCDVIGMDGVVCPASFPDKTRLDTHRRVCLLKKVLLNDPIAGTGKEDEEPLAPDHPLTF